MKLSPFTIKSNSDLLLTIPEGNHGIFLMFLTIDDRKVNQNNFTVNVGEYPIHFKKENSKGASDSNFYPNGNLAGLKVPFLPNQKVKISLESRPPVKGLGLIGNLYLSFA